ncbi:MAG: tetratricopeptide repeat protein [Nitrospira sp.]|jgi:tetratricopeptide (TPR) repeat protein|nr:tetratricopeptide repeat protein [Nitrospira sp.]
MSLRSLALLSLMLVCVAAFDQRAAAEDFTESWYLSRGRSNMEIDNYKAAIEAFEKVVERDPDHREALRSLGIAYERQGLKDKSIETFDRYLAKYDDDPEIAFKQAQALEWSRYASYREKDLLKYYRMGLKRKDDPAMRLKYAAHLAGRKETAQEAIAQYDRVLASQPRNAQAHQGLAKAYAWLGQNDQALYHANLGRQAAKREPGDMTALRHDMLKGREPSVEGVLSVLAQPEKPFELYGMRLGSRGKMDLSPFTTTTLEAGAERFWNSKENRAGGYLSFANQLRINPANRFDLLLEYHDAPRGDGMAYKFEYAYEGESVSIRPGVKREFRYDSFAALIGSRSSGQLVGLARSTQFYTDVIFDLGSTHIDVTPFIGWVTAESLSANSQVGLTVKTSTPLWETGNWNLSGEYLFYLTHYGENQSGFTPSAVEPRGGAYFSPQVFVNQIPRLAATYTFDEKQDITFAAGPALQYIDEATQASAFRVGGDAHVAYTTRLSKPWLLKVMGDYTQIANIYTRIQCNALLVYTFY